MPETVSSLPQRPLKKREVLDMDDAREYCIDPEVEEAYVISLIGNQQVHALGFDVEAGGWVPVATAPMEFSEEAFQSFEDDLYEWAESEFGDCLDDGDLQMTGPDDPPVDESENDVPPEVEMGLEAGYDCPDCEYSKTGLTTGPHAFLDHLQDEHGYSRSEAFDILEG